MQLSLLCDTSCITLFYYVKSFDDVCQSEEKEILKQEYRCRLRYNSEILSSVEVYKKKRD